MDGIIPEWREFLEKSFEAARDYLDFFPIVYYPAFFYATKEGLQVETVGFKGEFGPQWELVNVLVKKYHEPGRFVTFAGYEWTGDRTRWGDHNVFYFDDDQPLDLSVTIDELYANLRRRKGIAIPHHTGYLPGMRGKDWDHFDGDLSPFVEICSVHGSSEGCDTPIGLVTNGSMAPRVSGGTYQDGLARGYRIGASASGDNANGFPGRHGLGLIACYAKELTRESLWEAFLARRVYAVTGDRIRLDFRINGHFMGEVLRASGALAIEARVVGTQALDRIELIKNNRVAATHCHNGSWEIPKRGKVRLKVQIEHGWGPTARYGLKVGDRKWAGRLKAAKARIVSVEGCFTRQGQKIMRRSASECEYKLTTSPRTGAALGECQQSIVFEIEGGLESKVRLECEEISASFTLRELMASSRCLVMWKQVERNVKEQFGLRRDEIENAEDVLYHNAYKIKVHKAAPEVGYRAALKFKDESPRRGRSFYYVRVSQLNGQYAWSSPIWVER